MDHTIDILNTIKAFACMSVGRALASLAFINSSYYYTYINVSNTLQYYGLSNIEINQIYQELEKLRNPIVDYLNVQNRTDRKKQLENVIYECIGNNKVDSLGPFYHRLLAMISLYIVKKGALNRSVIDSHETAGFVSPMLSSKVDSEEVERVLVKSLLAVNKHDSSSKQDYPEMYLILTDNNKTTIQKLSNEVQSEFPDYKYVYDKLEMLNSSKPYSIAALMYEIDKKKDDNNYDSTFYKEAYGLEISSITNSLSINKIVYNGLVNPLLVYYIINAFDELLRVQSNVMINKYFKNVFEKLGYKIDFIECASYYCKYLASKTDSVIYIYTIPFALNIPPVSANENNVILAIRCRSDLQYNAISSRSSSNLANVLWIAIDDYSSSNDVKITILNAKADWQINIANLLRNQTSNNYI
ncbi:hypothetical protein V6M85_08225 [Sulfolobus tengchongensis]|uniref:Uncharacterized protein n=1 Tax=Sulfolobus tengchongensis TaxID=207809 RepID=A0AAX4KY29_9CREN